MYIPRYLEKTVLAASLEFPSVLVTGARQVGKTTLLKALAKRERRQRVLVSLDEMEIRNLASKDPALFLQRFPGPLFIDEIQYAPQLLPYLKADIDRHPSRKGHYWLSGSQQFTLMRGVSESMAGRVAILTLAGLSAAERDKRPMSGVAWSPGLNEVSPGETLTKVFQRIIQGGYPGMPSNAGGRQRFFGSYLQTYVERDLRGQLRDASLPNFEKFVRLCAASTACLLNLSDLARDAGVSVPTAKDWLGLLEGSRLVYLLRPYSHNFSSREVKAPKLHFLDTGLAAWLTGWTDPEAAARGSMAGALFETYVLTEILKSYWNRGEEAPLFHFRTKERAEVDFLLERDGKLMPVEVKESSLVKLSDLHGILLLEKLHAPLGPCAVIAACEKPYALKPGLQVLPAAAIR